jgi:hypothetical protein
LTNINSCLTGKRRSVEEGVNMTNMKKSFQEIFSRDIPVEIQEDYPTHVPINEMLKIICAASQTIGMDCYVALKHFKFTEEEIRDHLHNCHN